MKLFFIVLYFLLSATMTSFGQSSCYQMLKQEGQALYKKTQYEQAINKYLAALNCDTINQREISSLIKRAQRARQNELILERNTAQSNALTAQSILALKQEKNPSKACRRALDALSMLPTSITAQGAFIDAWYSQVFEWEGRFYSVPMAEVYRQTGILGSAVLSPDGRTFATASWDPPIVKLWLTDSGEFVSLLGFGDPVWRLCFSPGGNRLAVASLDGTIRIYSKNGQSLFRLTDHKGPIYDIKFSVDGRYLVSASGDGSAMVWNVETGTRLLRLAAAESGAIKVAAFSQNNSRILTAGENGKIVIWDMQGSSLFELNHGIMPISEAFFTSDDKHIVTAGEDRSVKIWDGKGHIIGENSQQSKVKAVVQSRNGNELVIGSGEGLVTVSDMEGKLIHSFQAHSSSVNGIEFSPDGNHFLTFSSDNTIKIWTIEDKLVLTLGEFTGPVLAAGFSADGNTVYGSSWDGSARLFQLTGHPINNYPGLGGNVQRVILAPDDTKILAVSLNGRAMVWRFNHIDSIQCSPNAGWLYDAVFAPNSEQALIMADSGILLWNLRQNTWERLAHPGARVARFFQNGSILTGAADGSLRCWTALGKYLSEMGKGADEICALDISADGMFIVTGHQDGTVALWSVLKQKVLWQNQYHTGEKVYSVSFSSNGLYLLSAGGDNRVFLWNRKGEPINVYKHAAPVTNAAFSSDGVWVLSYSVDGTAKLWKKDKDTAAAILQLPTTINCAKLSPNGKLIATASNDGIIRLWSREGVMLASMSTCIRSTNWIAFSTNSDRIISASSDGRVNVWDLNPSPLIKSGMLREEH